MWPFTKIGHHASLNKHRVSLINLISFYSLERASLTHLFNSGRLHYKDMSPFKEQFGTFYYEQKSFIQWTNYVWILFWSPKLESYISKHSLIINNQYDSIWYRTRYLKVNCRFGICEMLVVKDTISNHSKLWGVKLR